MTLCKPEKHIFKGPNQKFFDLSFCGGDITSDGGVLLLQNIDKKLGLLESVANVMVDNRRKASCKHTLMDMLRQRVFAIALGYEDVNDHDSLKNDLALQASLDLEDTLV